MAGASQAATFGPPVVVSSEDATEPGIDIAPQGTIYVNAPEGLLSSVPVSPSVVWRSDNGGASWVRTPMSLRGVLPGGGDSDISIDPATGKLAMTDLWLGSATVSTSADKAQSWLGNPLQGIVLQDRQWVAQAGGGAVYHVTHQIPLGLVVSHSIDGGLTYPVSSLAASPVDQTGCVCPPGNLIAEHGTSLLGLPGVGLADKVGVIYATSSGGVKFARSTNSAVTFASSDVSPASGAQTNANFPVVANAGAGKLVAVWQQTDAGQTSIRYADSSDWGASWSHRKTLVSGGSSVFPWVDARAGKVAVSLYHSSAAGDPATVPATAQWFESYLESSDGGVTFSALQTIDPAPVKRGPICLEGISCSGGRELGDFQSIALDPAGLADVSYVRSIDNVADTEVRFAHQTG
jgi:hypothetical protein